MPRTSKTDEFSEKFQTAFDNPPSPLIFAKVILQFFGGFGGAGHPLHIT